MQETDTHSIRPGSSAGFSRGAAAVLAAVLVAQFAVLFFKGINWDEFFHLHHVYEFSHGSPNRTLQTAYLRLVAWAEWLRLSSADRVVGARIVMAMCNLVTCASIFVLARRFVTPRAALLSVLVYASGGYVFTQATALRADPPATAAIMLASVLLSRQSEARLAKLIAAGVLIGVATAFTIKTVLLAPAVIALLWFGQADRGNLGHFVQSAAHVGAGAAFGFAFTIGLHSLFLLESPVASSARTVKSAGAFVFSVGLFPQARYLMLQALFAPQLVAGGILFQRATKAIALDRAERLTLGALCLPLLCLAVYSNSYPYFFVMLFAPLAVAIAPVMEWLCRIRRDAIVLICSGASVAVMLLREDFSVLPRQRTVSSMIESVLPPNAAYLDFCGMISNRERALPMLVSNWGLKAYKEGSYPSLSEKMATSDLAIVLANNSVLASALAPEMPASAESLPQSDVALLRANFVPLWQNLVWVAGKRLASRTAATQMHFPTPGHYRVNGESVVFDGKVFHNGDRLVVSRGVHTVGVPSDGEVTLRLDVTAPRASVSPGALFTDY